MCIICRSCAVHDCYLTDILGNALATLEFTQQTELLPSFFSHPIACKHQTKSNNHSASLSCLSCTASAWLNRLTASAAPDLSQNHNIA
jgi:hypothetical protein